MPYDKHEKMRLIPDGEVPCVWMVAGVVSYKLCDRNRDCESCPFDKAMRGQRDLASDSADVVQGLTLPDNLFYHQGHTWVEIEPPRVATVGLDDFAQKLVGNIDKVELPEVGTTLKQGERAWSICAGRCVDMLSPIDGEVVAVNDKLIESPAAVNENPYGIGWVAKVRPANITSNLKNLLSGDLVKRWMEKEVEELFALANRPLGVVLNDGGSPIGSGIAKSLDEEHWDEIAKEFFLTKD